MKKKLFKTVSIILLFSINLFAQNPVIIGGEPADISEAPWQVSIEYDDCGDGCEHVCGGVILNNEWILTAAHCVDEDELGNCTIHAGATDQTDNSIGQRIQVDDIILHDDWNDDFPDVHDGNDIALLHLSCKLKFNDNVQPISYATPENTSLDDIAPGTDVLITGWGRMQNWGTNYPAELRKAILKIISNAEAKNITDICSPPPHNYPESTMIAFYGDGLKSIARADSGGPGVVYLEDGTPMLVGICSWGVNPRPDCPSIYSNVRELSDFIDNNITISECLGNCVDHVYIDETITWEESDLVIDEDIVIYPNATLTIKEIEVSFTEGHGFILVSTGKLILDGATLTSCGSSWEGISFLNVNNFKGELIVTNNSIIENASIGINYHDIDDVTINGGSILRNNGYGINVIGTNSDERGLLDVDDVNFIDNGVGIMFEDANAFDYSIKNSAFSDNYEFGIQFNHCFFLDANTTELINCNFSYTGIGLGYCSGIEINSCEFSQTYLGIYMYSSFGIEVSNCTFHDEIFDAMWLRKSGYINITGCQFTNIPEVGIQSNDSNFSVHDGNSFTNCTVGIRAMGSFGDGNSVSIKDNNYFTACETAISLFGVSDNEGSIVSGNLIENNDFGIKVFGDNHFTILDNILSNDYNIIVNTSGDDHKNRILCNEHMSQGSGIQLINDNRGADFIGNAFSFSSWYDVAVDGEIKNNIGKLSEPALNLFSEYGGDIYIEDTEAVDLEFGYYLPATQIPYTNPNNDDEHDIPIGWEKYATTILNPACTNPPPSVVNINTVKIWLDRYCDLLEEYKLNPTNAKESEIEIVKSRLIRYYYFLFWKLGIEISKEQIELLLKYSCDNWFSQKKLYNFYVKYGECAKADSMLNVIEQSLNTSPRGNKLDSIERTSKQSFVAIQRIGLRYHCDSAIRDSTFNFFDSTFVFFQEEINILKSEAQKFIPEAAFARSLLYIATGETIKDDWHIHNDIYIQPQPQIKNFIEGENDMAIEVYPNPSSGKLYIKFKTKLEFDNKIFIHDIMGKQALYKNACSDNTKKIEIDVSSYKKGLYILSIEDDDGNLLKTEKIVINYDN